MGRHITTPQIIINRTFVEAVDVPCPGPVHVGDIADYVYDLCPICDPDVGPPIIVRDHSSFQFGKIPNTCYLMQEIKHYTPLK